jgi:CheY-like chemotaxis protein
MIKHICIIDDDKIYRFTTEKYIEMLKLADSITTFSDGEEALDYFKENALDKDKLPDIILLDVNMPVMDGWDFIEEYSKIKPRPVKNIVLYMVTSSIDERDRKKASSMSVIHDFVVKPIGEKQLVELIKKAFA